MRNGGTMSALVGGIYTRTDHTSRPARSALTRANPLEYAVTKNASVSVVESALAKTQDLKSPGMNTYKKHPGGPLLASLPQPFHVAVPG